MVKSKSRLAIIIGGIVGASLVAFCAGLLLTVLVIVPVREGRGFPPRLPGEPTAVASPSAGVGPIGGSTPSPLSPTPTHSIILSSPTPWGPPSSPVASATPAVGEQPTTAPPSPAPPPFPFHYAEGSKIEEPQCSQPYLRGWVRDDAGEPMNGITVEWHNWNNVDYAISGDEELYWQPGEFKFTYIADDYNRATDFALQVVESADNPMPLSEPLVIHYVNCGTTGQITNIVFKHY